MSDQAKAAMIRYARVAVRDAEKADKDLTASIGALCGAMMSKTDTDDVSLTDDTDTVFMDPRNASADTTTIEAIQYNDDGELIVVDSEGNSTFLNDLMIEARIALAKKLILKLGE